MTKRIQEKLINHDWLVGEVNQGIIGYAYYGSFRTRVAYHHTVESTIYLSPESMGKDSAGPCMPSCLSRSKATDSER